MIVGYLQVTAREKASPDSAVRFNRRRLGRNVSDPRVDARAGTEGDERVSTSAMRQPAPIFAARVVKPQRVGLIAARSKSEAQELSTVVARALDTAGAEVLTEEKLAMGAEDQAPVDVIIVLGGDGLMIRVANTYPEIPLLGINFGNVGFLALIERRDWRRASARRSSTRS